MTIEKPIYYKLKYNVSPSLRSWLKFFVQKIDEEWNSKVFWNFDYFIISELQKLIDLCWINLWHCELFEELWYWEWDWSSNITPVIK